MSVISSTSAVTDPLDRAIVRSLQLSPRVPFRALADVLDVSEQTVARRYRRLRRAGLVRVVAVVNSEALGESSWVVRLECRPSGAASLAQALAQRDDIGWVSVSAGGTQVVCSVRSTTARAREELLLQRLPRTAQVLGLSAAMVLHRFVGAASDDWSPFEDAALTAEQEELVRATSEWPSAKPDSAEPDSAEPDSAAATARPTDPPMLDAADHAILRVLAVDGRATVATLAAAAGLSEGRAARRMRALLDSGVAYLDLDAPTEAYGFGAVASLWLSVEPGRLDAAGRALAGRPEVPFAAAVTGRENLYVAAVCRDVTALYRFVTDQVGAIPGIASAEVVPILQVVKQAGTLLREGRLAT